MGPGFHHTETCYFSTGEYKLGYGEVGGGTWYLAPAVEQGVWLRSLCSDRFHQRKRTI